jgi:hypothetical protein
MVVERAVSPLAVVGHSQRASLDVSQHQSDRRLEVSVERTPAIEIALKKP